MSKTERGKRDGTGPYRDSAQRQAGSGKGKRQVAGEDCKVKTTIKKKKK